MEKDKLSQHEIKTAYVLRGERIYYIDAESPADAQKKWEEQHHHDNLVKDHVFVMEEFVKEANPVDIEVDLDGLKDAERTLEAEMWNSQMNRVLERSREKLRKEMGYGEKD